MNIQNKAFVASTGITNQIDDLGELLAQIDRLKDQADAIKEKLREEGVGTYDGALFEAKVYEVAASTSYDAKAMEDKLREKGVDDRWFSRHEKVRKGSINVKVTARK